ncbi:methyl-accepting chemotaxis protein [Saccharibacillus qingshengii]|uniref:methyl-accepting chemotaxis protein n=1 Tax=Saccharibacillus qingshengii TaxID=1763540 RepID=UPI0015563FBB|nr:methyl-accepting chemotaxis protein [Saccharibacillus qingshengii]
MLAKQNRLMLSLTTGTLLLSALTHYLNRSLGIFDRIMQNPGITIMDHAAHASDNPIMLNILLVLPALLLAVALLLYKKNTAHSMVPLLNTLSLTFACLSITAGGGGYVEFHFSIFMVVAFLVFYESVALVALMTAIFAVVHVTATFWMTELYLGSETYTLTMLLLHAVFLLLTSGAVSWQIVVKKRFSQAVEAEREAKRLELEQAFSALRGMSARLNGTFEGAAAKSETISESGRALSASFDKVSSELDLQQESVERVGRNLDDIHAIVEETRETSREAGAYAESARSLLPQAVGEMQRLQGGMEELARKVGETAQTIRGLDESAGEADRILSAIREVADRTNLLSLNASIEAARAGEQGRGFAVVASEIRALAQQSRNSAEEVNRILGGIREETRVSAVRMNDSREMTETSLEQMTGAISLLDEADASASKLIGAVDRIGGRVEKLADQSRRISDEMHGVSAVNGRTTDALRTFGRTAQHQVESSLEMNSELQELRQLSGEIRERFGA